VSDSVEAASIGVLDGPDVVYIERIQAGLHRLAVDVRVGNRVPAYSSALGRAILSRMPADAQRSILEMNPPRRLTDRTLIDLDGILAQIDEAGEAGFAISEQETVIGLRVIAAPVTDVDGVPIAAVSAAAPAYGTSLEDFIAAARDPVCDAATRLSVAVRASGGMAAQRPT
jgi:IclR family pca regulon transcriptional regulator